MCVHPSICHGHGLFPPLGCRGWSRDHTVSSSAEMPQAASAALWLSVMAVLKPGLRSLGLSPSKSPLIVGSRPGPSPRARPCSHSCGLSCQCPPQVGCGTSVSPFPPGHLLLVGRLRGSSHQAPGQSRHLLCVFQNQLLTKGMVILRDKIRFYEGEWQPCTGDHVPRHLLAGVAAGYRGWCPRMVALQACLLEPWPCQPCWAPRALGGPRRGRNDARGGRAGIDQGVGRAGSS